MLKKEKPDISVVMPCLNEEKTVGLSIDEAVKALEENHLSWEIIVVDNGSSDNSVEVAKAHGALVGHEKKKGYGRAIRAGIRHSRGKVIVIGDCDMTYDFSESNKIYDMLCDGSYDLVIGNRFSGNMENGAMSLLHKIGVRFLSALAGKRFGVEIRDFHCGLRGLTLEAAKKMRFFTGGMEFATEMVAEASKNGMKIGETDVTLRKCPYKRESKLRTFRDGFRHLIYILGK